MRLLDMERRQKQRVQEMRETQKKVKSILPYISHLPFLRIMYSSSNHVPFSLCILRVLLYFFVASVYFFLLHVLYMTTIIFKIVFNIMCLRMLINFRSRMRRI